MNAFRSQARAAALALAALAPILRPAPALAADAYTVSFPVNAPVGTLYLRDAEGGWERRGEVTGETRIPADRDVRFEVHRRATSLAALSEIPGERLKWLQVRGNLDVDRELAAVANATGLETFDATHSKITASGFRHLTGLPRLAELNLTDTGIGDACLEELEGLAHLRKLVLRRTKVTGAGARFLAHLPALEEVNLGKAPLTDEGARGLRGLTRVRRLYLDDTALSDAGVANLAGLTRLETLELSGTKVTDAGLEHLRGLVNLRKLFLNDTAVTDKGIERLGCLANLEYVSVKGTRVSSDGVAALRAAVPACAVPR